MPKIQKRVGKINQNYTIMAKCESCGQEIGTKRVCPHCGARQLKYVGETSGPDMFFWLKGIPWWLIVVIIIGVIIFAMV